jgi:poly(3-hydroxybutyrate) depolymerase
MMDSKQLALKFLANACDDMAEVCDKNINSLDKKKTLRDLEKEFGYLLAAIKEVTEEYKLDEKRVFANVEKAIEERNREI